jgi:Domain of unknown function (DUF5076)
MGIFRKPTLNQRPIPDAALRDEKAVEILRVWVAEEGLHCSLKIGMYEAMNIPEEHAWGTILADAARHVADALRSMRPGLHEEAALRMIRATFNAELDSPTSDTRGEFVDKH